MWGQHLCNLQAPILEVLCLVVKLMDTFLLQILQLLFTSTEARRGSKDPHLISIGPCTAFLLPGTKLDGNLLNCLKRAPF